MTIHRKPNDRRMFSIIREIRASARFLQDAVAQALERASQLSSNEREAYLDEALPSTLLARIDALISGGLTEIEELFVTDVSEREWCSGEIATILLTWQTVGEQWPGPDLAFEKVQQRLTQIGSLLDRIVYQCESLTLSPSINDTMDNLRVGQPLDFEFEFGPELPKDEKLKERLFQELAQESKVIASGVVDADQRVIYKASASRAAQRWSVVQLVLAWVAGGAVIPLALVEISHLSPDWPLKWENLEALIVNYVLIAAGSAAHLFVDALKAERAQTRPSFQAMHDWVLWLHVREWQMLWGIGWVVLGYVLISVGVPGMKWQSAFFAGYSIDSVTDVFLNRFSGTVKAQADAIIKVLK
jgi:hypothetical protein